MHFSGLRALKAVDIELAPGEIRRPDRTQRFREDDPAQRALRHAAPDGGTIRLDGRDITHAPAHKIAALGIARTFQNIRLFKQLTVLENVEVGAALHPDRPGGAALRRAARAMLEEIGLSELADRRAETLPYGSRRRLEIARALATSPTYLLLDEPAAGANEVESDALRELIADLRQKHGLGILIVDHDLRLIMRLVDRIVVLNEGSRIAAGSAAEVGANPAVREAYLGRRAVGGGRQPEPDGAQEQAAPA